VTRLPPVSAARGSFLTLPPAVGDSTQYFDEKFDWDSNITVVDMFAGAGGLSLGLDSTPHMRVVAAFERDPIAAQSQAANIKSAMITGDVGDVSSFAIALKQVGVRRVDVLAGGPPCQGFSRLGKGALRKLALEDGRGVDTADERNFMFREFIRAVRELEPSVVLMENVPEMAAVVEVVEEIVGVLVDLDYQVHGPRILAAGDHGVPQIRRRMFLVATAEPCELVWPIPSVARPTLRDAISDLPPVPAAHFTEVIPWEPPAEPGAYLKRMRAGLRGFWREAVTDHVTRAHRPEDMKVFAGMAENDRYDAVPKRLRRYRSDIFEDKYHRMVWDRPSWTVTAHLAKDGYKYIHPLQARTISVREAARIQSFPDRYRFAGSRTHRFAHIGNAVPPLLARAVGGAVSSLFD
jgi:DNA (cytosine-5)-methyltransferase 1